MRKYTYGLMFREWERYASVFSALGMTAEAGSRVGILGSTCAEVIFAFYGLNMVGASASLVPAYSALMPRRVLQTIRSEGLTDFIVTDDFAQASLISELFVRSKELGLKNIILLHVPVAGVTVNPMLVAVQEVKYLYLKSGCAPVYMDTLLAAYDDFPVRYAPKTSVSDAFILHTSGSTSGTGKPVVLSDTAFNAAAACFYKAKGLELPWEHLVTAVIVDLSNAYGIIDQVHLPFAMGATVVTAPGGILNPDFYKAIPEHRISFLFTVSAMFERWMKLPDKKAPDFSSLRFVVLGGASVSAADKRRYYEFMRTHGAGEITLLNGYGISELGGACCLSPPDIDDETIGYPLPGVSVRLYEEERGEYLTPKDAPCEGVLYLNSPSMATPRLDAQPILKTETIGGKPYICTNDLVRMDSDGRLTFLGRANRYFINEDGRRYESGRVETEFSRQSGIESCGVVPVYVKTTHDNIPMLCVKTLSGGEGAKNVVRSALRHVFISGKTLTADHIPSRVMIAKELPRNGNGKIDLYRITRGEVEGDRYMVEPVCILGRITDFKLTPCKDDSEDMIQEVFEGISEEIKRNLPYSHNNTKVQNKEEPTMSNARKVIENFNTMNKLGRQMMKNMTGQPAGEQNADGGFSAGFPDLSKMMAGVQDWGQKAKDKMPDVKGTAQKQAENVLPGMQRQMNQMADCMDQMNQAALWVMQKMFYQNRKLMNQMFDAAIKQTVPSDQPAEQPPEEPKTPESPAEE